MRIIANSYGCSAATFSSCYSAQFEKAISEFKDQGGLFVVSAGNDGSDNDKVRGVRITAVSHTAVSRTAPVHPPACTCSEGLGRCRSTLLAARILQRQPASDVGDGWTFSVPRGAPPTCWIRDTCALLAPTMPPRPGEAATVRGFSRRRGTRSARTSAAHNASSVFKMSRGNTNMMMRRVHAAHTWPWMRRCLSRNLAMLYDCFVTLQYAICVWLQMNPTASE